MAQHRNLNFLKNKIRKSVEKIADKIDNEFKESIKSQEYWNLSQKSELEKQGDFALTKRLNRAYEGGGGTGSIPDAVEAECSSDSEKNWSGNKFIIGWGDVSKLISISPAFLFYEFGTLGSFEKPSKSGVSDLYNNNKFLKYPLTDQKLIGGGWFFVDKSQLVSLNRPFTNFGRYGEGLILSGDFLDIFDSGSGSSLTGKEVRPIKPVRMYRGTAISLFTTGKIKERIK